MKIFNDISGKAMLYAIPLFLTPFADKMGPIWLQGSWPPSSMYFGCTVLGSIAACIGLRAFYDGSYERRKSGVDANDFPVNKTTTPVNTAETKTP